MNLNMNVIAVAFRNLRVPARSVAPLVEALRSDLESYGRCKLSTPLMHGVRKDKAIAVVESFHYAAGLPGWEVTR